MSRPPGPEVVAAFYDEKAVYDVEADLEPGVQSLGADSTSAVVAYMGIDPATGGFNGTDLYPTLMRSEAMVEKGEVHHSIAGAGFTGGPGPGAAGGASPTASARPPGSRGTTQRPRSAA